MLFNDFAAEAAEWTARQLSAEAIDYLAGLPAIVRLGEFTLAHGSPRDPIWEYVVSAEEAAPNFDWFEGTACFVGHSHVPVGFSVSSSARSDVFLDVATEPVDYASYCELGARRHLINVGSVGQPRDGDPRACYLILDTIDRRYCRRRVSYDISRTQVRMQEVGLPRPLWQRLRVGR
jgi:diadenosine tetraphosphatase ApaH/serine/threonine PP2A family protein phosphatase